MARVLVLHPPTSVARDFIDYPWFSDLGAVQAAAVLRAGGEHAVTLVDAHALPGSTLGWRDDGRAHLGASVDEVVEVARCRSRGDGRIRPVVLRDRRSGAPDGTAWNEERNAGRETASRMIAPEAPSRESSSYP